MTNETSITESASRVLEVLVRRGAVAGHEVKVRDLLTASGLSDSEFDRADTYLLQAGHVAGTMGGRDGSRWLTPAGLQFPQSRSGPAVARGYERIAVFAFGVAFVIALLVLAIAFPEPTAFQYTVFRIVLALAASGVVAFVPGFIEVDVNRWLRAGGAIAVFVIIYFFSPASLVTEKARVPGSQRSDIPGQATQNAMVTGAQGSTVYQAGRDIVVTAPSEPRKREALQKISSVMVEVRLTCELKANAELPPGEVNFLPVGDAHAYLEGAAGRIRLVFQSPVRFRRVDGDRLVVINRFTLETGSDLLGRPLEALQNYATLSVPVVTVVWGKSLRAFRVLEIFLSVNSEDPLYGSYSYNVPFREGPRFAVPLEPFQRKLFR